MLCWVGLNPSTADEAKLDPTLTRIAGFTTAAGFEAFKMLNLFAFRATDPHDMERAADPVGPDNDAALLEQTEGLDVVLAWGNGGAFRDRGASVVRRLEEEGRRLWVLQVTAIGMPQHPLYLPAALRLKPWLREVGSGGLRNHATCEISQVGAETEGVKE